MKWKIASLVLVTFPLSLWICSKGAPPWAQKLIVCLGMSPILAGTGLELWQQWRLVRTQPERYQAGSPVGNKIALVLAALIVICVVWAAYVQASDAPETVTVCDLTHFGAAQEGTKFRVKGIYATDFRHFTSLTDEKNDGCSIEFGVKQSDFDGSVARFNQAVVDAAVQSGPGIHHLVDAEVVFHWVTLPRDPFHTRTKSPAGVLELLRVFHSVPLSRSNS